MNLKKAINGILSVMGLILVRFNTFQRLNQNNLLLEKSLLDLKFFRTLINPNTVELLGLLPDSKSELRQDLFVLSATEMKKGGFFVEFGASDGLNASNTWLLETHFSWRGILVEPAKFWLEALHSNRPISFKDNKCIWSESGLKIEFSEAKYPTLSTLSSFASSDIHASARKSSKKYLVETITLFDLLRAHDAPKEIDYLSIDTEGSEYEIMKNFNFNEYSFKVITVEHNFSSQREDLFQLLTMSGYKRVYETLSGVDDWYVLESKS